MIVGPSRFSVSVKSLQWYPPRFGVGTFFFLEVGGIVSGAPSGSWAGALLPNSFWCDSGLHLVRLSVPQRLGWRE